MDDSPAQPLPASLARPAHRALTAAGYERLDQFSGVTESELLRLHGVGPLAVARLRQALADIGESFARDDQN